MKIKINSYDSKRNEFRIFCDEDLLAETFDPFVCGITNGEEYKELNESLVGKIIDVEVFENNRCLIPTKDGEVQYRNIIKQFGYEDTK